MNSPPRVLVLLAARNGSEWIAQQLASILAQQGVDLQVVVRDDLSDDTTREQVSGLRSGGRVRLSAAPVASGSASQNFFALIRENPPDGFDLIAFADQDDIWHPDRLARAARTLAAEDSAGYSSATRAFWPDGRRRILTQVGVPTRADFLFEGAGQGCTFVLTAQFYARLRLFLQENRNLTAPIHYHDWAIYALARSWRLHWSFDSRPSLDYRQHHRNDTGARSSRLGIARRLNLIRRGWYRDQLHAIANLSAAAAPEAEIVHRWRATLARGNRWNTARFCLGGGRRRRLDNTIVVLAALVRWI